MNQGGKRPNAGRPRVGEEKTGDIVGVRLSPELLEQLDDVRLVGQRTRSEWIRFQIEQGLAEEKKMQSFMTIFKRCADVEGVVRFHFRPGVFSPGAFAGNKVAPGYADPGGQWLDAQVMSFDGFGVALSSGHLDTFVPWTNIQQVTRRSL